jgi:NAD(P)-dependent dehydrogenase (short-subunit alcohol dehydrogenase family)
MAATVERARDGAPPGTSVTAHTADVSDTGAVDRFRDEVVDAHGADHVDLVFSNAGIGGGASFVAGRREEWERTFAVCWGGVYNVARAFVPLLVAGDDGWLVNTSSVNGFWASLGPGNPHTAYSTAKFAVKGFSEALLEDFRVHAPHVKVAVVMPGHVGTDIVLNSRRFHGQGDPDDMTPAEIERTRTTIAAMGVPLSALDDEQVKAMVRGMAEGFRDSAPLSAAGAATIILDGVRNGDWRILVGEDAHAMDEAVRADPLSAYGERGLDISAITAASGERDGGPTG